MLRISRLADYAIVLLVHVAREPAEEMHTARALARSAQLPLPTVTKILKTLARDGLLDSHRGKTGGYTLSRKPELVSVVDIIRAIDGEPAMTKCTEPLAPTCDRATLCPARTNWHLINTTVLEALGGLSLASMSAPLGDDWQRPRGLVHIGAPARRRA